MKVIKERFGEIKNEPVFSFTLINENGVEITVINYGCVITKVLAPDKNGHFENIVLGYDMLEDYVHDPYFLGAVIGRVAGRIRGASFKLDGKVYTLAANEHLNHIHGGIKGFDKVIWDAEIIDNGVLFFYESPDGEEGYPGNLKMEVIYTLNDENELSIRYEAISDQKTIVAPTNHSYFNLSGNCKRDVLTHVLTIKSNEFLELDNEFLPTGRLQNVESTPFDFTAGRMIKTGVVSEHPQNILVGKGYDHPFILHTNHDHEVLLKDPESGRTLMIETDEPAVVVYSGNSLKQEGSFNGVPSRKYLGICLETQTPPDAIHHSYFPSVILEKDKLYSSVTTYKFGIEEF